MLSVAQLTNLQQELRGKVNVAIRNRHDSHRNIKCTISLRAHQRAFCERQRL